MGWLNKIWTNLKVFRAAVWSDLVDTYERLKIIIIAIGIAVIYLEWEKIKAAWIVKSGQQELKSNGKQDQALAQKEQSDRSEADSLEKKAQNEPNPGDDWNTK